MYYLEVIEIDFGLPFGTQTDPVSDIVPVDVDLGIRRCDGNLYILGKCKHRDAHQGTEHNQKSFHFVIHFNYAPHDSFCGIQKQSMESRYIFIHHGKKGKQKISICPENTFQQLLPLTISREDILRIIIPKMQIQPELRIFADTFITAMKKLLITLSAILLLPVSSFSKVPPARTGEQADSITSVNGRVIDLLTLLFPEESYEFIEKTDSIIDTVRSIKGRYSGEYESWLWKLADICQKTQRYTMTKPLLDTLASIYGETGRKKSLYRLHESYAYYYLFTGNLSEARESALKSLEYARNTDNRLTAMKTLRDVSIRLDNSGEETIKWCRKMEPCLKRDKYSGSYISNLDEWYLAGGDSLQLIRKATRFRDRTKDRYLKAEAELLLWHMSWERDTCRLTNIINSYRLYRSGRTDDKELLISEKDKLFFSYYVTALSELGRYHSGSNPEKALGYWQDVTDIFEHPDTSTFYAIQHEFAFSTGHSNIHEFYIPALMGEMTASTQLIPVSDKYIQDAYESIRKIFSTYRQDIAYLTGYIENMPEYDIRIILENYYESIQTLGTVMLYLGISPDTEDMFRDFASLSLFYKGLLLRKRELGTASKKADICSCDYLHSLEEQRPYNIYFLDFIYLENPDVYLMCITGHDLSSPVIVSTDVMDRNDLADKNIYTDGTMYDRIWGKIGNICPEGSAIYFVPDKDLYSVNIEMLHDSRGTAAYEKYRLHRLSSFLELNGDNTDSSTLETAAIFGNSSDDLKSGGKEIDMIQSMLADKGCETSVFDKEECSKGNFFGLSGKSPDIIHFATHGFYLDDSEFPGSGYFRENYSGPEYYDRTMLNSGLLMSGNTPSDDSNVLLSKEIAGLDLYNTSLVFLSACESGLGDTSFDGVLGLQRAFKAAGVQSLILTLWDVSDNAATLFATSFYSRLSAGNDIHTAFTEAVGTVKAKYPEPYYWAAFILVD